MVIRKSHRKGSDKSPGYIDSIQHNNSNMRVDHLQENHSSSSRSSTASCTPSFSLLAMQCSLKELHYDHDDSSSSIPKSPLPSSPPPSPPKALSSPSAMTTGKIRFQDGRVFFGKHIDGHLINGIMKYQDGSVYEGGWVDGKRHGRGICTFIDGSVYEGDFEHGNFHGNGQLTWSDGGYYVGEWKQGEMDGIGKEVRPDGSVRHEGFWKNGVPIRRQQSNLHDGKVDRENSLECSSQRNVFDRWAASR